MFREVRRRNVGIVLAYPQQRQTNKFAELSAESLKTGINQAGDYPARSGRDEPEKASGDATGLHSTHPAFSEPCHLVPKLVQCA